MAARIPWGIFLAEIIENGLVFTMLKFFLSWFEMDVSVDYAGN